MKYLQKINKKSAAIFVSGILLTLPLIAGAINAQFGQPTQRDFVEIINGILNIMFPIFFALAAIIFLVAAYLFLTAQGDPEKLKTARDVIIWGVVAVIVAVVSVSIPNIISELGGF